MTDHIKKKEIDNRPSWDDYFMEVAHAISKRATCDRGKSGCVIAKDRQFIVSGYVGSPSGFPHCDEAGHHMKKVVHAEQNAICQAAKIGVSISGATLYTRMTPCRTCAMLLINCGIIRVVCERKYHQGEESEKLFKEAGIELVYKHNEHQRYLNNNE